MLNEKLLRLLFVEKNEMNHTKLKIDTTFDMCVQIVCGCEAARARVSYCGFVTFTTEKLVFRF